MPSSSTAGRVPRSPIPRTPHSAPRSSESPTRRNGGTRSSFRASAASVPQSPMAARASSVARRCVMGRLPSALAEDVVVRGPGMVGEVAIQIVLLDPALAAPLLDDGHQVELAAAGGLARVAL